MCCKKYGSRSTECRTAIRRSSDSAQMTVLFASIKE